MQGFIFLGKRFEIQVCKRNSR